ncbi:transposase InsO family protein [Pseudoxanthomonas broegbernensis]|nr:transposase InsO family protein [Pseudoxanthomonas broegbernensis]
MDNFTKESLAIEVDQQLKGEDVVAVMERLRHPRGVPQRIQTDNGSEFISITMDRWAYDHGVTMDYSRPSKPTDNPFIESFNGSFRDECLDRRRPARRARRPIHPPTQGRIFQFCSGLIRGGGH